MTNRTRLELLVLSLALIGASIHLQPGDTTQPANTFAPLLRRVTPAVVNVAATGAAASETPAPAPTADPSLGLSPQRASAQSIGSGVVVDANEGLILTNDHVIRNAARIVVTLADRRQFDAKLVASDAGTDVALLRIAATGLTALPFGDSDRLQAGDFVIAIGNPFGLGQTATSGIVSALGRSGMSVEGYEDFIQTDAAINPGSSGGPLIDTAGRLMGVNTAILSPGDGNVGIGFAIPANMVREVVAQLVAHGTVRRGRLGIAMQDVTPSLAQALALPVDRGALVTAVEPSSPAERVGIVAGDVIAGADGAAIESSADLRNRIGMLRVGDDVALQVVHEGSARTAHARIADVAPRAVEVGATIDALTGAAFTDSATPTGGSDARTSFGAFVTAVEHGSPAWRQGLAVNDVVVGVNRRPVASAMELADALRSAGGTVALHVVRGGRPLFVLVR
jgi:Do/DeqQ family serine protease